MIKRAEVGTVGKHRHLLTKCYACFFKKPTGTLTKLQQTRNGLQSKELEALGF